MVARRLCNCKLSQPPPRHSAAGSLMAVNLVVGPHSDGEPISPMVLGSLTIDDLPQVVAAVDQQIEQLGLTRRLILRQVANLEALNSTRQDFESVRRLRATMVPPTDATAVVTPLAIPTTVAPAVATSPAVNSDAADEEEYESEAEGHSSLSVKLVNASASSMPSQPVAQPVLLAPPAPTPSSTVATSSRAAPPSSMATAGPTTDVRSTAAKLVDSKPEGVLNGYVVRGSRQLAVPPSIAVRAGCSLPWERG